MRYIFILTAIDLKYLPLSKKKVFGGKFFKKRKAEKEIL